MNRPSNNLRLCPLRPQRSRTQPSSSRGPARYYYYYNCYYYYYSYYCYYDYDYHHHHHHYYYYYYYYYYYCYCTAALVPPPGTPSVVPPQSVCSSTIQLQKICLPFESVVTRC